MSKAETIAGRLKRARIDADMGVTEAAAEAGFTEMGLRSIEDGIVKRPPFLQVMRLSMVPGIERRLGGCGRSWSDAAFTCRAGSISMNRAVFAGLALVLTGTLPAKATMPLLADKPKAPTEASCREWAANQDEDALEM